MDMKPSRFTEEQIIGILREREAGAETADDLRMEATITAEKLRSLAVKNNKSVIIVGVAKCRSGSVLLASGSGSVIRTPCDPS